ncbi:MAG: hypothetical protein ACOCTT_03415 [archaeon]
MSKRDDFQEIIKENGTEYTLIRQTETTDSQGNTESVSEETYTIMALIQDSSESNRQVDDVGVAETGTSNIFFYDKYSDDITGNGEVTVKVGDIIEKDNKQWRLEEVVGTRRHLGDNIFKKGVVRRIDLE